MIEKQGSKLVLPFETEKFKSAIQTNQDGIGMMYPIINKDTGKLEFKVEKLKGTVAEQYEFLREHLEGTEWEGTMAIHMRYTTKGTNTIDNVHPFPILQRSKGESKDLYLMHNGTMSDYGDKERSDTRQFVEDTLRPILLEKPSLWNNPAFIHMMEKTIGIGNKQLIMDEKGKFIVLNRKSWTEKTTIEGTTVLLSNTYSMDSRSSQAGEWKNGKWVEADACSFTQRPTRPASAGNTVVPFATATASTRKDFNAPVKGEGKVSRNMDDQQIEFIMDAIETMSDVELIKYVNENPEEMSAYLRSLHLKFKFDFQASTAKKKEETKDDSGNSYLATGTTLTPITNNATA